MRTVIFYAACGMCFAFLVELLVDVEKAKRMLSNAVSFAVLFALLNGLAAMVLGPPSAQGSVRAAFEGPRSLLLFVMAVIWKLANLAVWPLVALGIWRWISELWPKKPKPSVDN
jgi:hypothetical protein